jgi:phenylpyruvate tautomerase PptA (4-oxalocrotonate tautomerase family)
VLQRIFQIFRARLWLYVLRIKTAVFAQGRQGRGAEQARRPAVSQRSAATRTAITRIKEAFMPLVHISLLKGKPPAYIRAISDGVHEAPVETYKVPAGDRFQLIHQHERYEFIYDPDYLDVRRTDDAVFIHIFAGKWRDLTNKRALYRAIADRLSRAPGLRRDDVQVVISPNDGEDWSLGNGVTSYVKETEPL